MTLDEPASLISIVKISAGLTDQWRLTDPYLEEVWSEFLGPTATLLARRLGRMIEQRPGGVEVDSSDLGASVGVGRMVALRAVERLHRFEVVHCDLDRGIVGVSGYAPSVDEGRLFRLSEAGRVAHERMTAASEPAIARPGRASELLTPVSRNDIAWGVLPIAPS